MYVVQLERCSARRFERQRGLTCRATASAGRCSTLPQPGRPRRLPAIRFTEPGRTSPMLPRHARAPSTSLPVSTKPLGSRRRRTPKANRVWVGADEKEQMAHRSAHVFARSNAPPDGVQHGASPFEATDLCLGKDLHLRKSGKCARRDGATSSQPGSGRRRGARPFSPGSPDKPRPDRPSCPLRPAPTSCPAHSFASRGEARPHQGRQSPRSCKRQSIPSSRPSCRAQLKHRPTPLPVKIRIDTS
jgi:hypothetical protein